MENVYKTLFYLLLVLVATLTVMSLMLVWNESLWWSDHFFRGVLTVVVGAVGSAVTMVVMKKS